MKQIVSAMCAGLLAACLLVGGIAQASEDSERAYSRGLVEFHAERYPAALQLFDAAVAADPHDCYALFYRSVTRGRLNQVDGAAADLRAALALKPAFDEAALELGVVLVQAAKYDEAIAPLEQAQRAPELEARASLFLGLCHLRLEQRDAARQSFERAAAGSAELDVPARYYLGVISYQAGDRTQAEEYFAYVAEKSPTTAMGREAASFIARMHDARAPLSGVYGAVGFQYDSNVLLAPSDETEKALSVPTTRRADGRATILAGGTLVPWHTEHVQLSLGYEFFQSLHFNLREFDLQDHRPSVGIEANVGIVTFGLLGRYDYYLLDNNSFMQEATALPSVIISEGDFGHTETSYRLRRRDFKEQPFSGVRDAFNHAVAVNQFFYLGAPERYVAVGYQFDHEDPINAVGEPFAYDGQQVSGGIGWAFPAGVLAAASYSYRHETYDPTSLGRRDNEHRAMVVLRKLLNEYLSVTAAYMGTINNSTDKAFEYDRHIGSLALEVRY